MAENGKYGMKILVTGASGFIGANILRYLKERGYNTYGCGRRQIEQKDDTYLVCNLAKEFPDFPADIIIHAAAVSPSADVGFYDYFDNNVLAVRNILQYAKTCGAKRLIYTAAVSSYGKVDGVLREDSPHNHADGYGLTKYVGEELVRNSQIPYYILVLPGVVGKGCRDNWIMNTARQIYNNQNVTYFNGDGMFNNILDVTDLCRFISTLTEGENNCSETYLLGAKDKIKVKDVVEFLKESLGSKSQLTCVEKSGNSFYLDISRALNAGFSPKSVKEILVDICEEMSKEKEMN